jgi:hypothetical protein
VWEYTYGKGIRPSSGPAIATTFCRKHGYTLVRSDKEQDAAAPGATEQPAKAASPAATAADGPTLPPKGTTVYFRRSRLQDGTTRAWVDAEVGGPTLWERRFSPDDNPSIGAAQATQFSTKHGYTLVRTDKAPKKGTGGTTQGAKKGAQAAPPTPRPGNTTTAAERAAYRAGFENMTRPTLAKVAVRDWHLDPDDYADAESLIDAIMEMAFSGSSGSPQERVDAPDDGPAPATPGFDFSKEAGVQRRIHELSNMSTKELIDECKAWNVEVIKGKDSPKSLQNKLLAAYQAVTVDDDDLPF